MVTTMNNNGFIVVHRSLIDWEWYTDEKVARLFIHCLLKANHADKKFRGKIIERGSFQTSYQMLSDETGLSVRSVRTSLNKLKTTGELTIKTSSQNTVICEKLCKSLSSIATQVPRPSCPNWR
jgi:hypothetical protein